MASFTGSFFPLPSAEFVNPLEKKYKCTLCQKVLQDPTQSSCGHRQVILRYSLVCLTLTAQPSTASVLFTATFRGLGKFLLSAQG